MDEKNRLKNKELAIQLLTEKTNLKQKLYRQVSEVFKDLKDVIEEVTNEINESLSGVDDNVYLEYEDKGSFEAQLKIGGDILIFNMHTNIFDFSADHNIRQFSYFYNEPYATLSGIISIYNFLTDSFRFNRYNDLGYMIGRMFVNKDKHYMLEGKRQLGFLYNDYAGSEVTHQALKDIVYSAILVTLDFDLYVPPYDKVSVVSVETMMEAINRSKGSTGKRLGFRFSADNDEL